MQNGIALANRIVAVSHGRRYRCSHCADKRESLRYIHVYKNMLTYIACVMVFPAFEQPSIPQWTCLHLLACDDNEAVRSVMYESSLSSNNW